MLVAPSPSLSAWAAGQFEGLIPQNCACQSSGIPSKLASRPQVWPVAGADAGDVLPSVSSKASLKVWTLPGRRSGTTQKLFVTETEVAPESTYTRYRATFVNPTSSGHVTLIWFWSNAETNGDSGACSETSAE